MTAVEWSINAPTVLGFGGAIVSIAWAWSSLDTKVKLFHAQFLSELERMGRELEKMEADMKSLGNTQGLSHQAIKAEIQILADNFAQYRERAAERYGALKSKVEGN